MRKLNIFLSSAMTGELDRERDGLRILFQTDSTLKEFFELYAVEGHASPYSIQKTYVDEVRKSNLLILLLDRQLRTAVENEFSEARIANLKIFIYIRNRTDKRDARLVEFIGQEAYQFHCGSFNDPIDLCSKVKNDILSDLIRQYSETIKDEKKKQDYVVFSPVREHSEGSLRHYDYNFVTRISQSSNFKDMDTDQLVILAASIVEQTGNLKEALLIYEIILLRDPFNWYAYNNRGLVLNEMGYPEDALFSYKKALDLNRESHVTLYNIGNYYRDKYRYDEAIDNYNKALQIRPDKVSALRHLVEIYITRKEYHKALEYAQKAYLFEENEINLSHLCMALTFNEKKEEALTKSIELKGTKYHEKTRAYIFYFTGEWKKCIVEVDCFFKIWNYDYELAIKKALCLIHLNEIDGVIRWVKEIEGRNCLHPTDYNNIAWALYEKRLNLDFSAELLRKSIEGDPTILAAWKNLQCVLAELMELEEGLNISDQALQYFPDDPNVIMNRVKFLFLSGNIRQSVSYAIEEFTRLFGGTVNAPEIEKIINQSFMDHGIKDIDFLEKILVTLVQLERGKVKKTS